MDMRYNLIQKERCMVMKMNKKGFIEELVRQTGYEKDKCIIISNSLEDNFLFGKKNKCKTITALMENLKCDESEANRIYEITNNISISIILNNSNDTFKSFFSISSNKEPLRLGIMINTIMI